MESQPLISVIIPVYNVETYLRQGLDSVCGQTYKNLEILCVDDGSTDGSLTILREYEGKDPRVRVFTQSNAGVSAARNTAQDAATGEWLAWLDPDDWLEPQAYATAMQGAREGVDLVCFGTRVVAEAELENRAKGVQKYLDVPFTGLVELTDELLPKLNYNLWNKLYRRSLITEHALRSDVGLRCGSDMCFNAYFNAHARAAFFIDAPLYCYRLRSGSISYTPKSDENRCATHLVCMEKMLGYYRDKGIVGKFPIYLGHHIAHIYDVLIRYGGHVGAQKKWVDAFEARLKAGFQKDCPELVEALPELIPHLRWLRQVEQLVRTAIVEGSMAPRDAVHVAVVAEDECQMLAALLTLASMRRALAGARVCVHVVAGNVPQPSISRLRRFDSSEFTVRLYGYDEALLRSFPFHEARVSSGDVLRASVPLLLRDVDKVLLLPCGSEVAEGAETLWTLEKGADSVAAVLHAGDSRSSVGDVLFLDLAGMREAGKSDAWLGCLFLHYSWRTLGSSEALRAAFPDAVGGFSHGCGVKVSETPSMRELGLADLERSTLARRHTELRRRLWRYWMMSHVTWGKKKRHYVEKKREFRALLRSLAAIEKAMALYHSESLADDS